MILRLKALRSLRWNYRWSGVWAWLKGRRPCHLCRYEKLRPRPWCPLCYGSEEVRGWERIVLEPERVIAEQTAAAEGVFV